MFSVSTILIFLWLCVIFKAIFFWIYLWQLKEYHTGRFIDHFRTEKGKKLLFNWANLFKLILLLSFFPYPLLLFFALLLFYILQFFKIVIDVFKKRLKKPILTKKTVFLVFAALAFYYLLLLLVFFNTKEEIALFSFWLLVFDFFSPKIVSLVVLIFQPLAVLGRNVIIAKAKRKRNAFSNLKVVGVTGSYGKTSTKEFLAAILSLKFNVLKTKEHQNSEVGISQCILENLKEGQEIFVAEIGAYNKEGIKLLCDIAKPQIGVLTGINEQHMATFGSQENIVKAKFELIEFLPPGGVAVLNWDNDFIVDYAQKREKEWEGKIKIIKYSLSKKEDLWAENLSVDKDSVSFKMVSKDGDSADFKVNALGGHNVLNILAAAAVAREFKMSLKEISESCSRISSREGAMKIKRNNLGWNIIDSSYSANPQGLVSDFEYLKVWPQKKILIMPCLIELGKSSKEVHERIGGKMAGVFKSVIITTEDKFKEIKKGFLANGGKEDSIFFMQNPVKIFEKLKSFSKEGDVVLLESRVPKELIQILTGS